MNITGDRLKGLRSEKGLSQSEVADILGVTRVAYLQYEKGVSRPVRKLRELADLFNVSTDYILGKSDLRRPESTKYFSAGWLTVPISGAVAAGKPICVEATPGEAYVDIPPHIARGHTADDFLCVIAQGESMEPTILDGDKLVFLRDSELHGSRNIHAISFDDYQYTAKLVKQEEDGTILITALNPSAWEPMVLSPAKARERCFRIYGYLVYLARDIFIY